MPQFTEVHPELEQAVLMERQDGAAIPPRRPGGIGFDGVVVRDEGDDARPSDPVEDAGVAPVEPGAKVVHEGRVRCAVHRQEPLGEAGMQADHVARLHRNPVRLHDPG